MSGFDVQMRSDQLVLPMRQHAADQEIASYRQAADAVTDARNFAQQKMESDAKIETWEVERQVQQRKLMELQSVDMTEMSRLQIAQQRAAVEAMNLENDTRRKALSEPGPSEKFALDRKQIEASMFKDNPMFTYDMDKQRYRASTKEERDERTRVERESRYPPMGASGSLNDARDTATIDKLDELIEMTDDPDVQEALQAAKERAVQRMRGGETRPLRKSFVKDNKQSVDSAIDNILKSLAPGQPGAPR
jgi:hypothetical protein